MPFEQRQVREGDEVWILFGCNLPVILRPLQTRCVNSQGRDGATSSDQPSSPASRPPVAVHSFLGSCYVDGIMDGEALDRASDSIQTSVPRRV